MTTDVGGQTVARRQGWALATVCAVVFLTFLDTTIVSVALADIQTKPARRRVAAAMGRQRLRAGVRQPA